jgi:hypothetical protein
MMASREPDLTGYTVGIDPKPDQAVEVLCRDQFGGYNLPFSATGVTALG